MLNTTHDNKEEKTIMSTNKIFVYINSHAAHFTKTPIMEKYLSKKIGHSTWVACNEVMIPEVLQEDFELFTESFFHGITTYQYTLISEGGTFINPLLYGLTADFMLWNDVIHTEPDFYQDVVYVDVPFDMYKKVAQDDPLFVSEDDYNKTADKIKEMVNKLKETYYPTGTLIH